VTGGSSGIGLATAKRFANEGAYVFITGRRDLAAAVKETGINVTGVQGDVSNLADLDRLFAAKVSGGRRDSQPLGTRDGINSQWHQTASLAPTATTVAGVEHPKLDLR
jgi:NAD(P)-dependent dehydrogenase (short-subunit alcohol dehydrogenase family)